MQGQGHQGKEHSVNQAVGLNHSRPSCHGHWAGPSAARAGTGH